MSKLRVNTIVNEANTGGPSFPEGLSVTGNIVTSGNISCGGTITYNDVTDIDSVGIVTARSGIKVTTGGINVSAGIVTSTDGFKGRVQDVPKLAKTSAYTLVATDAGKVVSITTGGVTVPNGVFSGGDIASIYNNSGSNQTITQGSGLTMRQVGTSNTGNRTLSQRGFVSIYYITGSECVISGGGLS